MIPIAQSLRLAKWSPLVSLQSKRPPCNNSEQSGAANAEDYVREMCQAGTSEAFKIAIDTMVGPIDYRWTGLGGPGAAERCEASSHTPSCYVYADLNYVIGQGEVEEPIPSDFFAAQGQQAFRHERTEPSQLSYGTAYYHSAFTQDELDRESGKLGCLAQDSIQWKGFRVSVTGNMVGRGVKLQVGLLDTGSLYTDAQPVHLLSMGSDNACTFDGSSHCTIELNVSMYCYRSVDGLGRRVERSIAASSTLAGEVPPAYTTMFAVVYDAEAKMDTPTVRVGDGTWANTGTRPTLDIGVAPYTLVVQELPPPYQPVINAAPNAGGGLATGDLVVIIVGCFCGLGFVALGFFQFHSFKATAKPITHVQTEAPDEQRRLSSQEDACEDAPVEPGSCV